jgi:hypothetical protein
MRDRRDRDRGERRTPPAPHATPAPEPAGPAVQAAPPDLPQPARSTAPILPPLTPPQPSWKQELKESGPAAPEKEKEPES